MEAMSLGKPVMAFIMPSVYKAGISKDCPIINVNADNLEDAIRNFVKDPHALNQIGMASRKWMEDVHDVKKLTERVEKIYLEN
jgi:glycosyltransferase involved in cell wall biosynthesis